MHMEKQSNQYFSGIKFRHDSNEFRNLPTSIKETMVFAELGSQIPNYQISIYKKQGATEIAIPFEKISHLSSETTNLEEEVLKIFNEK